MSNKRSWAIYISGALALVLTFLGVWGLATRRSSRAADESSIRQQESKRGPRVNVAAVTASSGTRELLLQGEARPFQTVTLYAKVSGYLTKMRVDKGDRVRANELIAEISSPELDQQVLAATADARNKRSTADRSKALAPSGVVSKQELDGARANADVAEATQASLASQRQYGRIRAPFDGVVTARFADPGTLIQSAANGQSGAVPIATVSKTDRLRIYVYVDQGNAAWIHVGDPVEVRLPERPEFLQPAQVSRIAGELATRTRTMLTEIDLDNTKGQILAGSFVQVSMRVHAAALLEIPVAALIMRGDRAFVAIVDDKEQVHYRPVVLADDDGKVVRIADGLRAGQRIALNLGSQVEDGAQVQIVNPLAAQSGGVTGR